MGLTGGDGVRDGDLQESILGLENLRTCFYTQGAVVRAVDGISLTVTHVKKGEFGVSIIPHTLKETTLGIARVGDSVNLETDIIAKYVEKLISGDRSLTLDNLKDLGF